MTSEIKRQPPPEELKSLWAHHNAEWRDPMEVISLWDGEADQVRDLLQYRVTGAWWDILDDTSITLLISREYEHLVMAMCVLDGKPFVTYLRLPHPSGIAYDADSKTVHIAATRNPNQVFAFKAVSGTMPRSDMPYQGSQFRQLVPVQSNFYPGSLYIHDLAVIGGELYANSVGQNAIVRLSEQGQHERVWWPKVIETEDGPVIGQNHLQLNSIAAGTSIVESYFSASIDVVSTRRPGHKNFPVDKRGVIFSGQTREVIARGLTRPHSACIYDSHIWVDNSGYGELGYIENGQFRAVTRLPGWTRGLTFHRHIAFVGTSRVIPRFSQYAPGLEVESSICGLHAVDTHTGKTLGSLVWPYGNQIFALKSVPRALVTGFPFHANAKRATRQERQLFYAFETE